jgi:hypothetical protein
MSSGVAGTYTPTKPARVPTTLIVLTDDLVSTVRVVGMDNVVPRLEGWGLQAIRPLDAPVRLAIVPALDHPDRSSIRTTASLKNGRLQDCGALRQAGCERIFIETASGARTDRSELAKLLETVRNGDTIVCWRHRIEIAEQLQQRGIALRSLTEAIDTGTTSGRFLFNILGARRGAFVSSPILLRVLLGFPRR